MWLHARFSTVCVTVVLSHRRRRYPNIARIPDAGCLRLPVTRAGELSVQKQGRRGPPRPGSKCPRAHRLSLCYVDPPRPALELGVGELPPSGKPSPRWALLSTLALPRRRGIMPWPLALGPHEVGFPRCTRGILPAGRSAYSRALALPRRKSARVRSALTPRRCSDASDASGRRDLTHTSRGTYPAPSSNPLAPFPSMHCLQTVTCHGHRCATRTPPLVGAVRVLPERQEAPGAKLFITATQKSSGGKPVLGATVGMDSLSFPVMLQVSTSHDGPSIQTPRETVYLSPLCSLACYTSRQSEVPSLTRGAMVVIRRRRIALGTSCSLIGLRQPGLIGG